MAQNLQVATPESDVRAAARMMEDRDVGAIPVVDTTDDMHPIGIITDRDIALRIVAQGQDADLLRVTDAMSTDLLTVKIEEPIEACVRQMAQRKVRRALVVDDKGGLVGIVAQADIALTDKDHETAELVEEVSEPGHAGERRYY